MSAVAIVKAMATVRAAAFCSQGREPTPTSELDPPFAPPITPRPLAKVEVPPRLPEKKVRGDIMSMTTSTQPRTVAAETT